MIDHTLKSFNIHNFIQNMTQSTLFIKDKYDISNIIVEFDTIQKSEFFKLKIQSPIGCNNEIRTESISAYQFYIDYLSDNLSKNHTTTIQINNFDHFISELAMISALDKFQEDLFNTLIQKWRTENSDVSNKIKIDVFKAIVKNIGIEKCRGFIDLVISNPKMMNTELYYLTRKILPVQTLIKTIFDLKLYYELNKLNHDIIYEILENYEYLLRQIYTLVDIQLLDRFFNSDKWDPTDYDDNITAQLNTVYPLDIEVTTTYYPNFEILNEDDAGDADAISKLNRDSNNKYKYYMIIDVKAIINIKINQVDIKFEVITVSDYMDDKLIIGSDEIIDVDENAYDFFKIEHVKQNVNYFT